MLPSDYDLSPPLPPRTIEDQLYVAYAHDDIHTAKILLLKLKGVDVTSDDDPRIAAVQDEDFDFCFIPNGKLISEEEEKVMAEAQRREQIRRQREERLRACEYVWEHAKRRMREERLWLQRRRELEERRRTVEEAERQRALREREAAAHEERVVARARMQRRNVVCYETLPRTSSQHSCDDPFIYDVMPPSSRSTPSSSPKRSHLSTPSSSPTRHCHTHIAVSQAPSRSVSFKDVTASLNGPLFPVTVEERRRRMSISETSKSRGHARDLYHQRHIELLDTLLSCVEWENADLRLTKGKAREVAIARPCRRCSIDQLSTSTSCSSVSSCPSLTRSNSWLSFVSRSPDTLSPLTPPLITSWLRRSIHCRTCQLHSGLVPVQLCDTPLHFIPEITKVQPVPRKDEKRLVRPRRQSLADAAVVVAQGLGQLLEVAKQFQRAYMMAAVYNGAELNNTYNSQAETTDYSHWHKKRSLIPAGMRARSTDLKLFLESATPDPPPSESAQYIPLISPFPPKQPPRTELPNPLPYSIVFKPHPAVARSPSRLQFKSPDDRLNEANLRIRFVSNPAYLRLKALQNIIYERGINWEGHGSDCGFSSGKEALPGIAVDGLGRSWLSVC